MARRHRGDRNRARASRGRRADAETLYRAVRDASVDEIRDLLAHAVRGGILNVTDAAGIDRLSKVPSRSSAAPSTIAELVDRLEQRRASALELKKQQDEHRRAMAAEIERQYRDAAAWKGFPLPSIDDLAWALAKAEDRAYRREENARRRKDPTYRQRVMDLESLVNVTIKLSRNPGGRPPTVNQADMRGTVRAFTNWVTRQRRRLHDAASQKAAPQLARSIAGELEQALIGAETTASKAKALSESFVKLVARPRTSVPSIAIQLTAIFFGVSDRTVKRYLKET